MILCFNSYEDKVGMYYNMEVDYNNFCKEDILKEVTDYYKSIDVEEFFLSDVWEDENDSVNELIRVNYQECYIRFLNRMEIELEDLKDYDEEIINACIEIHGTCYKDVLESAMIHGDIIDFYHDILENEVANGNSSRVFENMIHWLSESQRYDYFTAQGYNVARLNGGKCLTW